METTMTQKDELRNTLTTICAIAVELTLFLTAGILVFLAWLTGFIPSQQGWM